METGCWLLGGEFEDSVFEERRERQLGPPSSYIAKRCEPQVRERRLSASPQPLSPALRGSRPDRLWKPHARVVKLQPKPSPQLGYLMPTWSSLPSLPPRRMFQALGWVPLHVFSYFP